MTTRPDHPVPLGPATILTLACAARLLQMRRVDAIDWLHARGLVVTCAGRERVIWGDVLAALRDEAVEPSQEQGQDGTPMVGPEDHG